MLEKAGAQRGMMLAVSLASIALGIIMLTVHERNLPLTMIWGVAAMALILGLLRTLRWLTGRGDPAKGVATSGPRVRIDLWAGIGFCVLAAVLAVFARPLSSFVSIVLGAYVLIDGLFSLVNALRLRRIQFAQWKTVLILAIIPVVLGTLMIVLTCVLPEGDSYALAGNIVSGVGLMVNGGVGLWKSLKK